MKTLIGQMYFAFLAKDMYKTNRRNWKDKASSVAMHVC